MVPLPLTHVAANGIQTRSYQQPGPEPSALLGSVGRLIRAKSARPERPGPEVVSEVGDANGFGEAYAFHLAVRRSSGREGAKEDDSRPGPF